MLSYVVVEHARILNRHSRQSPERATQAYTSPHARPDRMAGGVFTAGVSYRKPASLAPLLLHSTAPPSTNVYVWTGVAGAFLVPIACDGKATM
jgi:hypothetical protein